MKSVKPKIVVWISENLSKSYFILLEKLPNWDIPEHQKNVQIRQLSFENYRENRLSRIIIHVVNIFQLYLVKNIQDKSALGSISGNILSVKKFVTSYTENLLYSGKQSVYYNICQRKTKNITLGKSIRRNFTIWECVCLAK